MEPGLAPLVGGARQPRHNPVAARLDEREDALDLGSGQRAPVAQDEDRVVIEAFEVRQEVVLDVSIEESAVPTLDLLGVGNAQVRRVQGGDTKSQSDVTDAPRADAEGLERLQATEDLGQRGELAGVGRTGGDRPLPQGDAGAMSGADGGFERQQRSGFLIPAIPAGERARGEHLSGAPPRLDPAGLEALAQVIRGVPLHRDEIGVIHGVVWKTRVVIHYQRLGAVAVDCGVGAFEEAARGRDEGAVALEGLGEIGIAEHLAAELAAKGPAAGDAGAGLTDAAPPSHPVEAAPRRRDPVEPDAIDGRVLGEGFELTAGVAAVVAAQTQPAEGTAIAGLAVGVCEAPLGVKPRSRMVERDAEASDEPEPVPVGRFGHRAQDVDRADLSLGRGVVADAVRVLGAELDRLDAGFGEPSGIAFSIEGGAAIAGPCRRDVEDADLAQGVPEPDAAVGLRHPIRPAALLHSVKRGMSPVLRQVQGSGGYGSRWGRRQR